MAEYKFNKLKIGSDTFIPRQVTGDNNSAEPAGALLLSGAGRTDNSPAGDTWIFYDSMGATATPWGFKHEQKDNYISFYGAGTRTSYINLQTGNIVGSFTGNLTGNVTGNCSGSAGSVAWDNVSGKPSVAIQKTTNDFVHSSNEWTVVPSGYSGALWLNYRTTGGTDGNITDYNFGNGKGGCLATISNGQFSGNAATATSSYNIISSGGTNLLKSNSSGEITITSPTDLLTINSTGKQTYSLLYFSRNGTRKACTGYYEGMAFISNETSPYPRIGVKDDGTPQYWASNSSSTAQTLLHTGNYTTWCATSGHNHNDSYAPISHGIHWNNFLNRSLSSASWGTLTTSNGYTPIFWMDSVNGGGVAFSDYNGQTFMQIDGDYYANEGRSKVWHTGNLTKVSQLTNDSGFLTSLPDHTHNYVPKRVSSAAPSGTTTGWYRCATLSGSNSSNTQAHIISLQTSYYSPQNEHYIFAIVVGYNGQVNITQLTGVTGGHLLPHVRVVYNNSGNCYFDVYKGSSGVASYTNTIRCEIMAGDGSVQTPTLVSDAGGTVFSFDTYYGMKTAGNLCCSSIVPVANATYSLASSGTRFTNGYFSSAVYAAGGFYESSDEKLKDIQAPLTTDLEKLSHLRKVYFNFKEDPSKTHIGVIAQDIKELYPEIVNETDEGTLNVDYSKLSVIALDAIDTLHKENEEIKKRLEKLESLLLNQ